MKTTTHFLLDLGCFVPILLALDPWTPPVFLCLAFLLLLAKRPGRAGLFAVGMAACAFMAFWVFVSNRIWIPGPDAESRAFLLALRAFALAGTSLAFGLAVDAFALLNEAMQLLGLPVRWGYALFVALNALPRSAAEARHVAAVHRARLRGKASPPLARAVAILALGIRNGERAALAMNARGLARLPSRTWLVPVAWNARDAIELACGFAVEGAALAFLVANGFFRFGFF